MRDRALVVSVLIVTTFVQTSLQLPTQLQTSLYWCCPLCWCSQTTTKVMIVIGRAKASIEAENAPSAACCCAAKIRYAT